MVHIVSRPIRDEDNKSVGTKTLYTLKAVVQFVYIFNCLAYDWTVTDE
jgi:hypothetical protein